MILLLTLGLCSSALIEETNGGASLWVKHVTASKRVSVWTNKAQLEEEAMLPSLPQKHRHPWALQTRWDLTSNVDGAPLHSQFVLIEMGSTPFCGVDTCADTIVLFGLQTVNGGDTQLTSYKSTAVPRLVKALHANATNVGPLVHFSDLHSDNVTIVYKFYPGNSSFYGVGGGTTMDGGRIEVRELIAHNLVAPLEVFVTAQGKVETEYVTPLVYHHSDDPSIGARPSVRVPVTSADAPAWPPQIAPVMPTMFMAHVRGFIGSSLTDQGVWHYDWPRDRLRNDFIITESNRTFNRTQLWLAAEKKFYYFDFPAGNCSYSDMDLGLLRPDSFEHAMRVDPYSKTNPGGGRYAGRVMQDGRWSDHFTYGQADQQFNIWYDIETNLPLYDYGPSGGGEIGGTHWSNWTIGRVPEYVFDLDTSHCSKSTAGERIMRVPNLIVL